MAPVGKDGLTATQRRQLRAKFRSGMGQRPDPEEFKRQADLVSSLTAQAAIVSGMGSKKTVEPHEENPFGRWSTYRAQVAAYARSDAGTPEQVERATQLLRAARLAETILRDRDLLTSEQRATLRDLLK